MRFFLISWWNFDPIRSCPVI